MQRKDLQVLKRSRKKLCRDQELKCELKRDEEGIQEATNKEGRSQDNHYSEPFPDLETEAIFEDTSLICLMQNLSLLDTSWGFVSTLSVVK